MSHWYWSFSSSSSSNSNSKQLYTIMYLRILLSLLSLLLLFNFTNALYEDQVDKFDWRQQFVGRPKHILRPAHNLFQLHQSLILSSEANTLAALHLRNGSITWRHQFESAANIDLIDSNVDENVAENGDGSYLDRVDYLTANFEKLPTRDVQCPILSVNGGGRYLRCWNSNGLLLAEHTLPTLNLLGLIKPNKKLISPDSYTILYDTVHDGIEPQLLMVKISYPNYSIDVFLYGLRSRSLVPTAKYSAGRWLTPSTSCRILTNTIAESAKTLVCADVNGLELQVLSLGNFAAESKASATTSTNEKSSNQEAASTSTSQSSRLEQGQFKRIPLSSFGLKSEQKPKYLQVESLPFQGLRRGNTDRTVTISKSSNEKNTEDKNSKPLSYFSVNLGGDGYLLLSLEADDTVELVKVLPGAVKLTIIPLIASESGSFTSSTSSTELGLVQYGLAVLFTKPNSIPYQKEDQESLSSIRHKRVFAAKLVVFNLSNWSEISTLSSEQILLEFGGKRPVAPLVTTGRLAKRLEHHWSIDIFDIIPIRIVNYNQRTGVQQYRHSYKLILGTTDGTLIVLNLSGKINWAREEALAEITKAVFVDLPLSEAQATLEQEYGIEKGGEGVLSMFQKRIQSQIVQLQVLLKKLAHWWQAQFSDHIHHHRRNRQAEEQQEFELDPSINSNSDDYESTDDEDDDETDDVNDQALVRDYFGLHKVIVIRTKVGKLFALDSLSGKIIWTKYVPELRTKLSSSVSSLPIWIQRTSAHYPRSAIATILADDCTTLYTFDPLTGLAVNDGERQSSQEAAKLYSLPYKVVQTMLIHTIHDSQFRRPLLLLDDQQMVHLYPNTVEMRKLFLRSAASNHYMLIANRTSKQLIGYNLALVSTECSSNTENCGFTNGDTTVDGVGEDTYPLPRAQPVWSFQLPQMDASNTLTSTSSSSSSKERIVNLRVVFKRPNEHVHSQGRALGDRNVLYKYLNPNLVAVLWETRDEQDKSALNLFLLDSVTGALIYSIQHRRARSPIQIVHSENWIIYSYYNEKHRRTQISSIDLYEGFKQINGTAFSSIGRDMSFLPFPEQNSFIFPTGISVMVDTDTLKGLTNKHILIALPSGGLLELPRTFLDPRRPLKPTQEHAEEGLIPYMPELPILSETLINYNKTIYGIKGIKTAPTSLESTSLVFAYGLDTFYTRVTPSKTFDVLKEDFDFYLIALVLSALIIFSYLAKLLAARKALNAAWK